jgi:hypothetical protein
VGALFVGVGVGVGVGGVVPPPSEPPPPQATTAVDKAVHIKICLTLVVNIKILSYFLYYNFMLKLCLTIEQ